jgi:hypothetical protein
MTYDELVEEIFFELRDSGINPDSAVVKNLLLKVYGRGIDDGYEEGYDAAQ